MQSKIMTIVGTRPEIIKLCWIINELDIKECRVNCRMDQVNRYLDNIVNEKTAHHIFV